LKEFPQAELHVIGHLDPGHDWGSCQDRVKHIPFCPWQSLPGLLAQLDINLAPLELDNPFCQAKSEIKYVEAGLVKVPTIAAATEAFQAAIHDGDNGRLALTPDDWEQALAQLVLDGELRLAMGERAYLDTLARYHPLVRARELLVTLNAISRHFGNPALFDLDQDAQPRSPGRSFIVNEPQLKPLWQRVLYTLRYRGLQIFLLQVLLFLQVRLKRVAQHLLGQFQPRDVASL
jgi:hypothetical protein